MKKIGLLLVCLAVQCASVMAQDVNVDKFLNNFKEFVTEIEKVETPTEAQKEEWKVKYAEIKEQYTTTYEKVMTNDQLETYFVYRGQYNKRIGREGLKTAGEALDSASVKVGKAVKRGASKASGFLKGVFKRDKK